MLNKLIAILVVILFWVLFPIALVLLFVAATISMLIAGSHVIYEMVLENLGDNNEVQN